MAERPSFNFNVLSTATKILLVAGALFFIDTFLPWQRVCIEFLQISECGSASAWEGSGAFAGVLAGILSILLLAWLGVQLAGVRLNLNVPAATVTAAVAGGTVLFALIKFLIVLGNSPGYGAFIGLILAIVIAYGAYMKWQEAEMTAPPSGPPPSPPPGPPPIG